MAQYIQHNPKANRGEKVVENFLKRLPDNNIIFAEYKIPNMHAENDREGKPDFIVLSPKFGLLCLEVKEWNIHKNIYSWIDQYKIRKIDQSSSEESVIENPFSQADRYKNWIINLVKRLNCDVMVTSFVVFATVSRVDFQNRFSGSDFMGNPQSRFFFDMNKAIFKDDLEKNLPALEKFFSDTCRKQDNFRETPVAEINKIYEKLLPPEFSLGTNVRQKQSHLNRVRKLSENQRRWAFELQDENALILDIAGSGKTSSLVSRAIYLSNKYPDRKMLLTTYNEHLTEDLRKNYQSRLTEEEWKHPPFFTILSLPSLAKDIVKEYDAKVLTAPEQELMYNAIWVAEQDPQKYKTFDYIFVDEVQDFSDNDLALLRALCKSPTGFFLAGDIGQQIYNKSFNLRNLNIMNVSQISLSKEYIMYRTPPNIACLALEFVKNHQDLRSEFEEYGYFDYNLTPSNAKILLEFRLESLSDILNSCLTSGNAAEDILIITVPECLDTIKMKVKQIDSLGLIKVLDYKNSKGFEAPCVILHGIEDLAPLSGPFTSVDSVRKEESLFRRLVYIALTRTMAEAHIAVQDPQNVYIRELMRINERIGGQNG